MRARPALKYTLEFTLKNPRALLALAAIFFATASFAHAAVTNGVGIEEHLGAQVSINTLRFRDETGKTIPLSTYFRPDHPVILAMVYYECPGLCTFMLNGLTDSMRSLRKSLGWTVGKRFDIVVVSINPRETPELASRKKAAYVGAYDQGGIGSGSAAGWHFLTGEESQIRELASQVGFQYRQDGRSGQYAHGSAIYVMTPEGKIARYLYGIDYRPRDVRLALLEASHGKIGTALDRFLLLCYRYDPKTRHYEAAPNRVIAMSAGAGGAGTFLVFGGFLAVIRRREKEKERA